MGLADSSMAVFSWLYSRPLLLTVDLNLLVASLAAELPELSRIIIEGMDEAERASSARPDADGIIVVQERIHIYVGSGKQRRRDWETQIESSFT